LTVAEHKVGNTVVLVGTIVQLEGNVAVVRVDRALTEHATIVVRLGTLPAVPYDEAHGDEDRIRDAMTEAFTGRPIITR
jgi:hypothetical protein